MAAPKFAVSFRISQDARALLEELTRRFGLTRSATLELSIRQLAREWDVQVPTKEEVCEEYRRKGTV